MIYKKKKITVIHFDCEKGNEPKMTFIDEDLETCVRRYECPKCGDVILIFIEEEE